jgi:uncharacterized membrane protein
MDYYGFLGYLAGSVIALFIFGFVVIPFIIIFALFNDKTYKNVKAEIKNRPNFWEQITKQK